MNTHCTWGRSDSVVCVLVGDSRHLEEAEGTCQGGGVCVGLTTHPCGRGSVEGPAASLSVHAHFPLQISNHTTDSKVT